MATRLDAFTATVVNPEDETFEHSKARNDLHGLYMELSQIFFPALPSSHTSFGTLASALKQNAGASARSGTKTVVIKDHSKSANRFDYLGSN